MTTTEALQFEREAHMREAAARPMTIGEAADLARRLRETPELVVDGPRAKQAIDTLFAALERSTCYLKATLAGEEVFVLRQSDRAAVEAIRTWAHAASLHGCRDEKVRDAHATAGAWLSQPVEKTKWPD